MEIANQGLFVFNNLRDAQKRSVYSFRKTGKPNGVVIFEIITRIGNRTRNRITVRTCQRVVKIGNHASLYSSRDKMLQTTSFFMYFMPLHTQHIYKKAFCETMAAQNCFSSLISGLSQRY